MPFLYKYRATRCEEKRESFPAFFSTFLPPETRDILSFSQPASFGLVSGFCSGFFLKKVGKAAVVTSGVVFILLQSAAQGGYLSINWTKIEKDFNSVARGFQGSAGSVGINSLDTEKAASYFTEKTGIASGAFMGGFLLGLKKG